MITQVYGVTTTFGQPPNTILERYTAVIKNDIQEYIQTLNETPEVKARFMSVIQNIEPWPMLKSTLAEIMTMGGMEVHDFATSILRTSLNVAMLLESQVDSISDVLEDGTATIVDIAVMRSVIPDYTQVIIVDQAELDELTKLTEIWDSAFTAPEEQG